MVHGVIDIEQGHVDTEQVQYGIFSIIFPCTDNDLWHHLAPSIVLIHVWMVVSTPLKNISQLG